MRCSSSLAAAVARSLQVLLVLTGGANGGDLLSMLHMHRLSFGDAQPRFQRPVLATGEDLDFGVQVFAKAAPPPRAK